MQTHSQSVDRFLEEMTNQQQQQHLRLQHYQRQSSQSSLCTWPMICGNLGITQRSYHRRVCWVISQMAITVMRVHTKHLCQERRVQVKTQTTGSWHYLNKPTLLISFAFCAISFYLFSVQIINKVQSYFKNCLLVYSYVRRQNEIYKSPTFLRNKKIAFPDFQLQTSIYYWSFLLVNK